MSTKPKSFQAPKGTRDFYPEELLRRRYIAETWRAVSIRHGFEEIDGPTFEHADLYTVKSGEGILSELFSFKREGGDDLYALRPEFTPTLARMYAARARQLPSPTRWFCIPNFFRAENPQRGRLREFYQWNVDVLGEPNSTNENQSLGNDAEIIELLIESQVAVGLTPDAVSMRVNDRKAIGRAFEAAGIPQANHSQVFSHLDRLAKSKEDDWSEKARALGMTDELIGAFVRGTRQHFKNVSDALESARKGREILKEQSSYIPSSFEVMTFGPLLDRTSWCVGDPSIVRGLAYYTGTVFEVIAEGERAIAGGGRYDNLVELFGGPPTPACGFGMGDVVLSLVLEDRGLMPKGMGELMDAVECVMRSYSMRPDAFVFSNGDEAAELRVVPLLAELRRGVEAPEYQGKPWRPERYAVRPLHARTTGKTTRNVGKLMKDAAASNARFAVIIESGETCTLKNLITGEEHKDTPIEKIAKMVAGG